MKPKDPNSKSNMDNSSSGAVTRTIAGGINHNTGTVLAASGATV